ncbi:unnamed protein product [Linum trigynum]|uniref:Uncharacterized protein n=1 Tax=Linum trigynum TaxID=586398 RepID=A0AAV2DBL6_9ROSI
MSLLSCTIPLFQWNGGGGRHREAGGVRNAREGGVAHQLASAAATIPNNPPLQQTLEGSHSSSPLLPQILSAAAWQDIHIKPESHQFPIPSPLYHHPHPPSHHLSTTALLQKASTLAATQAAAAQTQMSLYKGLPRFDRPRRPPRRRKQPRRRVGERRLETSSFEIRIWKEKKKHFHFWTTARGDRSQAVTKRWR